MQLSHTAFSMYMTVTSFIFFLSPATLLLDDFPELKPGSLEFKVGKAYCEVSGILMVMLLLRQCPGPRGILMAMCAWLTLMSKVSCLHILRVVNASVNVSVSILPR
jgi:hypothetical protein